MQIFHEDTNTITLSAGISKFRFDPDTYEYHFSLSGNTKVGDHVATWSTPMGNYVIENLPAPLTKCPAAQHFHRCLHLRTVRERLRTRYVRLVVDIHRMLVAVHIDDERVQEMGVVVLGGQL